MTQAKFMSPGTFISESDFRTVRGFTLKARLKNAIKVSKTITQRYGAKPYSFWMGGIQYFLPHCRVHNVDDLPKTESNYILISNCKNNNWQYIVQTTEGWLSTHAFDKKCALLNNDGEVILKTN